MLQSAVIFMSKEISIGKETRMEKRVLNFKINLMKKSRWEIILPVITVVAVSLIGLTCEYYNRPNPAKMVLKTPVVKKPLRS